MSSSTNQKLIKSRNKSFIRPQNHQISEQFKQRRKSCNCESCGQLSSLQFKFLNLQSSDSHLSINKPKKYQSIESTYMDSQDAIIANNQIHKPQAIEVKLQRHTNPNTSLIQTNQFHYPKKQRSNSCCCDECGNITKFQSSAKLIYIQQIIKNRHTNFRIKRNLDQMFKGISPIEKKQEQEPEDDENYSPYTNQITSFRRSNLILNQRTKLLSKGYQGSSRKVFLKDACKTTFFTKTNSNTRDLTIKPETYTPNVTKKKLNLPIVKSSNSKSTQVANEVQLFKFTPKLNSINLIS
ncbi:unnamed protein product [Paramecium octaurelia]|uniref:Uncharacterized protein n=1 Tax=Paramecium octaurelia TaxID=43137 RepID=A0A8S1T403_PAROT|nr:unnamed protein product [Paramecium octaurelia]